MDKTLEFEVKAQSLEEAIEIAKKENNITNEKEFNITAEEISKGKSILGIINTKSIFKVKITKKDDSEKIKEKIEKILSLMEVNLKCEVKNEKDNFYKVNLKGEDNGIIIGKKGKTLSSFEYLINTLIKDAKIEIDVEGFKKKREQTLIELAKKVAEKVLKTNKAVKLNPMPPNERKILHSVLNEYEKLETYSEGKDPNRYIVVKIKKEENK